MKKLAIISTHPIQYNAPWIKLLHERRKVQVKVFYTWPQSQDGNKYDAGFGRMIKWDIPLLEGYSYVFTSATPKKSLKSQVAQWSPDALLVIGWRYKGHFACMRHFKGKIPVLFRGDSTLTDEKKGLRRKLRRIILSLVYKHIDFSLYVGSNNKEYFKAHGLKEHQLIPAYHAIDNDRFYRNSVEKNERLDLRRKLQIPPSSFVVLFAGKLEKKKNPLIVLVLILYSFIPILMNSDQYCRNCIYFKLTPQKPELI